MLNTEKKQLTITNLRNSTRLESSLFENGIDFVYEFCPGYAAMRIYDVPLYNYILSIRHDDWKDFPPIIEMYDSSHKWDFIEGLDDEMYTTKRVQQLRQKVLFAFPELLMGV